jgi:hypothetical protein
MGLAWDASGGEAVWAGQYLDKIASPDKRAMLCVNTRKKAWVPFSGDAKSLLFTRTKGDAFAMQRAIPESEFSRRFPSVVGKVPPKDLNWYLLGRSNRIEAYARRVDSTTSYTMNTLNTLFHDRDNQDDLFYKCESKAQIFTFEESAAIQKYMYTISPTTGGFTTTEGKHAFYIPDAKSVIERDLGAKWKNLRVVYSDSRHAYFGEATGTLPLDFENERTKKLYRLSLRADSEAAPELFAELPFEPFMIMRTPDVKKE